MSAAALFVLALVASRGQDGTPSGPRDFEVVGAIEGTAAPDTPVRVMLTAEVFAQTRAQLADVRVYDDLGRETPYVVHEQTAAAEAPVSIALEFASYNRTEAGEEIVLQSPSGLALFEELEFVVDGKDFHKRVDIAAGGSLDSLRPLARDVIFDFSSRVNLRRTRVRFAATVAAVFRISLADADPTMAQGEQVNLRYEGLEFWTSRSGQGPFRVDRVVGRSGELRAEQKTFDHQAIDSPTVRTDENGDTIIDLGVQLPVAEVTLNVENSYYHRRVQLLTSAEGKEFRAAGSGVIYKVPGMPGSENVVAFVYPTAHLRLKVLNEDNPLLRVKSVDVAWVRRNLYFVAEAGRSYRLYVGSNAVPSPRYELTALIPADPVRLAGFAPMSLSPLRPNSGYAPRSTTDRKGPIENAVLRTLVVILVCVLSIWAYRLLKRVPRPQGDQAS